MGVTVESSNGEHTYKKKAVEEINVDEATEKEPVEEVKGDLPELEERAERKGTEGANRNREGRKTKAETRGVSCGVKENDTCPI